MWMKQVRISSGVRIRQIDSDTCRKYWMTTVALGVIGLGAGLCAGGVPLNHPCGIPIAVEGLGDVPLLSIPVRHGHADPACSGVERAGHSDLVHQRMGGSRRSNTCLCGSFFWTPTWSRNHQHTRTAICIPAHSFSHRPLPPYLCI